MTFTSRSRSQATSSENLVIAITQEGSHVGFSNLYQACIYKRSRTSSDSGDLHLKLKVTGQILISGDLDPLFKIRSQILQKAAGDSCSVRLVIIIIIIITIIIIINIIIDASLLMSTTLIPYAYCIAQYFPSFL